MDEIKSITEQLQRLWQGQTLATLQGEAAKELNGTCLKTLRSADGPRMVLLICMTGEYELRKFAKPLGKSTFYSFGDWTTVSLFEAVARAIMLGGFCYDEKRTNDKRLTSLVFVAVGPDVVWQFESMFRGLRPEVTK